MTITTHIKVHNNVTLGVDYVEVSTSCHSTIDIIVPNPDRTKPSLAQVELDRQQLREFLARTQPAFIVQGERYEAE